MFSVTVIRYRTTVAAAQREISLGIGEIVVSDWGVALAQRDAAMMAVKAIDAHDGDALSNASDARYETCDNCHNRYMKKRNEEPSVLICPQDDAEKARSHVQTIERVQSKP